MTLPWLSLSTDPRNAYFVIDEVETWRARYTSLSIAVENGGDERAIVPYVIMHRAIEKRIQEMEEFFFDNESNKQAHLIEKQRVMLKKLLRSDLGDPYRDIVDPTSKTAFPRIILKDRPLLTIRRKVAAKKPAPSQAVVTPTVDEAERVETAVSSAGETAVEPSVATSASPPADVAEELIATTEHQAPQQDSQQQTVHAAVTATSVVDAAVTTTPSDAPTSAQQAPKQKSAKSKPAAAPTAKPAKQTLDQPLPTAEPTTTKPKPAATSTPKRRPVHGTASVIDPAAAVIMPSTVSSEPADAAQPSAAAALTATKPAKPKPATSAKPKSSKSSPASKPPVRPAEPPPTVTASAIPPAVVTPASHNDSAAVVAVTEPVYVAPAAATATKSEHVSLTPLRVDTKADVDNSVAVSAESPTALTPVSASTTSADATPTKSTAVTPSAVAPSAVAHSAVTPSAVSASTVTPSAVTPSSTTALRPATVSSTTPRTTASTASARRHAPALPRSSPGGGSPNSSVPQRGNAAAASGKVVARGPITGRSPHLNLPQRQAPYKPLYDWERVALEEARLKQALKQQSSPSNKFTGRQSDSESMTLSPTSENTASTAAATVSSTPGSPQLVCRCRKIAKGRKKSLICCC
eukprot:TRINITY_DN3936_c0_g1_i1.p1 TRINITY_DN3936_c0_g1~~TRINITY_DN3936_c0_g1_i1.p1  ORF type:complete len:636 (+),score=146.24 TRINITY_DN3936_c0_g1_i1:118-2025(+)